MAENNGRGGAGEVNNGRRSDVWSHFVISKDSDGKDMATCKHCQKSLGAETKNGTTHLKRHLGSCTRQDGPPAAKQQRRPPPDGPSAAEPSSVAASTSIIRDPGEASALALAYPAQGVSSWSNSNQEECAAELARMVAFQGYPSSIVEDECFSSFVRGLNPQFQMPSRAAVEGMSNTRAVDAMNQLMEMLGVCSGQISLVTDTIETGQGRALYMACQFIDDEWAFQKRIMQVFRVVRFPPYGHTALLGAEDICLNVPEGVQKQMYVQGPSSKLEEAVRRWGLRGRLFSVAWGDQLKTCLEHKDFLDNLCHIIHVGEGSIEIPEVLCVSYTSDVLDLVGVTFLEALDVRYEQAYLKTVKDLHLSHEKRTRNYSELGLNHVGRYDKRWYSYYCALEVLHKEYSDQNPALVLEQPRLNQSQLMEHLGRLTPTEMEAEVSNLLKRPSRLKESVFTDLLRTILGAVYRALVTISCPNGPTANLCLAELMKLRAVLQSEAQDATTIVAKAVAYAKHGGFLDDKDADAVLREVQDVLDNHIKETYMFLSIPAVLDPRFKLEYVAAVLTEVCGSEAPSYISRVEDRIDDIFEEHRRKLHNVINPNGEGTSRMTAGTRTAAMDLDGNSDERDSISEWERYLTDGLVLRGDEGQDFDVLVWWKANSSRYPTVASMTRDALAMPTSDLLSPEHIARIRSMMSSYCLTYPEAQSDD